MNKKVRVVYSLTEKIFFNIFSVKEEFRFIGLKNYLQYSFFQKIIRMNSQIPWPVHISSVVTHWKNIHYTAEITPLGYSPNSYIQAANGIVVGSNVIHAKGLTLISANHEINDFTQWTQNEPIVIGDNCWLGANITILPEVELGNHTIVAAGSVVTKSFSEGNCVIAGVPAKIVKNIDSYNGMHYFLKNLYVKNNIIKEKKDVFN